MQRIAHGGGINGFSTYALRMPEQKVFVAVLTNADDGIVSAEMIATKAAAAAVGQPFTDFKPVVLTTQQLDAVTGVYKIDDKSERIIRREQDKLMMLRPGRPPAVLQPFSATGFFVDNTLAHFEFGRNAAGEVNQITVHNPEGPVVNPRTGPVPADPKPIQLAAAEFDKLVGRYALTPQFILEVSREGERFYTQASGQGKIEIVALSPTLFWAKSIDGKLQFGKSADGKEQLVMTQNGRDRTALRLP